GEGRLLRRARRRPPPSPQVPEEGVPEVLPRAQPYHAPPGRRGPRPLHRAQRGAPAQGKRRGPGAGESRRQRVLLPDPDRGRRRVTRPARILLVEDDQSLALGLEFNLRRQGYETAVFSDAESAGEAVAREEPF